MSIDQKCYDLACAFLADVRCNPPVTDEDRTELGEMIQQTIEDFIAALQEDDKERFAS